MYKLFLGLKKIGEFATILEATKYDFNSGLAGLFSLIGNNYRDAWYVPKRTTNNKN